MAPFLAMIFPTEDYFRKKSDTTDRRYGHKYDMVVFT